MSAPVIALDRERRLRALDRRLRPLLSDPVIAARTRAALAGTLACPDLEIRMVKMKSTSLRLSEEQEQRADALLPALQADPNLSAFGELSRATVLRLAVHRGLLALEAEYLGKRTGEGR